MSASIPAVVIGASGYVGGELLRLIAGHPHFDLAAAISDSAAGKPVGDLFGHLAVACVGNTSLGLRSTAGRIPSVKRSVATVAAPVKALADAIEVAVVPGTPPIEAVVDAIATPVETGLGTVALAIEAHRAVLVAVRRSALGKDVETTVGALTAAI